MTPVRILVADDHEIFRHGVRTLLERQAGWIVCGEASTGRDAVAKAVALQPDVVVLDISMPELNGLEVVRKIRSAVTAKILILTVHESDQIVTEVVEAGAHGYVLKADAGNKLVRAVHAVLHDQTFFTERVRPLVTPATRRSGGSNSSSSASDASTSRGAAADRRREVEQGDWHDARGDDQDGGDTPGADHDEARSPLED